MIIKNNDDLMRFIPNVLVSVEGERTLYEKLTPFLALAENALVNRFTGAEIAKSLDTRPDVLRNAAAVYVANEAFRLAVPSLDLVLTPNGFGIVNNQNVVPASKERVERLLFSLAGVRDKAISTLIVSLADDPDYSSTPQGKWFAGTLFLPLPDHLSGLADPSKSMWEEFLRVRAIAEPLENEVAEEFVSPELMERLRMAPFEKGTEYAPLAGRVRRVIARSVAGAPLDKRAFVDIVDLIRKNPGKYPEWHASRTAGLFTPPVFENEKTSGGYWF